jgi:RNA polymerase sigma-70 factor (ECF subfamily)
MDAFRRRTIHDAMVRLADGERSVFPVLLDQLWPVILAFAQRGLGHAQDAEDVAQEVFLRVCSRISDFDRRRDGLSWVFGIASYEIMSQRRRRPRRREADGSPALQRRPDPAVSQEEAVMKEELTAALTLVIGALSREDRLALGLLEGPEAKTQGGAAVRKRRQRALERLRLAWRRIHGEP